MKRLAVIIGRFQPPHIGHIQDIVKPSQDYDYQLFLLGSMGVKNEKNWFNTNVRWQLLKESAEYAGIKLTPIANGIPDFEDDHYWAQNVVHQIELIRSIIPDESEVTMILSDKDGEVYANWPEFREYKKLIVTPRLNISATDVRKAIIEKRKDDLIKLVYPPVYEYLVKEGYI